MENKAREYAINALKEQIDCIEAAYMAGYDDALKTIPKPDVESDLGIKYIDLGIDDLMWSEGTIYQAFGFSSLPYYEAVKYNLPTQEQFEVFFSRCKYSEKGWFTSPLGKRITLHCQKNAKSAYLWVKSEVENNEALAYKITKDAAPELVRLFTGYEAKLLSVRPKEEMITI